ncbi:MAG: SsrA-binding protein SmpB [Dehalococcoidia bacterium]
MEDKTITFNRKALHDFFIEDSIEAGIVLTGTEIKSIRMGRVNIKDSYARPIGGELWLVNAHIAAYKEGNRYNHDPKRARKLLLNKREIRMLSSAVERKGLTLVPLKLYLKNGRAKLEIGLAKGKKKYDKRKTTLQRQAEREMDRIVKSKNR